MKGILKAEQCFAPAGALESRLLRRARTTSTGRSPRSATARTGRRPRNRAR